MCIGETARVISRRGNGDDEMSVPLVEETGVPGGNRSTRRKPLTYDKWLTKPFTPRAHAQSQYLTRATAVWSQVIQASWEPRLRLLSYRGPHEYGTSLSMVQSTQSAEHAHSHMVLLDHILTWSPGHVLTWSSWITFSHGPWGTFSHGPWGTFSHGPWGTFSHGPWGTFSHGPWSTFSHVHNMNEIYPTLFGYRAQRFIACVESLSLFTFKFSQSD